MQIMTLKKLLLTFYPNLKPFFTCKHGKNQLTFLSMVGVDPPLRFIPFASAAPSKKRSCNQEKTMHACYFSTRGLEIKHQSNKTYKNFAFGTGKVSFY
jgi:hypothetical protein